MVVIRRLTLLFPLIIAAGLLVSCVPVPPYDAALAQKGVYIQQQAESSPWPRATAPMLLAQAEPTNTPVSLVQVEPTVTAATPSVQVEPSITPVTVTIAPTKPADAQAMAAPLSAGTPAPTAGPTASATSAPTSTRPPTSTVAPTRAVVAAAAPTATATADQHLVVITEDDIARAVASGAGAQQGVTVDNLKVQFADGKTRVTADRLGYGIIKMQNLDLVGRLVAQNGVLSLAVESISPRGLAANLVPTAVNQALANFGSQWYVEDVRTLDGRVELRVR